MTTHLRATKGSQVNLLNALVAADGQAVAVVDLLHGRLIAALG